MQPVEHVPELLLLLVRQRLEQPLHLSGLGVRNFEDVAEKKLGVDQPGPGEQMDEAGRDSNSNQDDQEMAFKRSTKSLSLHQT